MAWPADNTPLTPGTEAAIPLPITYTHPTTGARVEVVGGPYLDISRHTPYGILDVTSDSAGNNHANAWQWALDNMHRPDPQTRVSPEQPLGSQTILAGGPEGCFWPVLPATGSAGNGYWKPMNTVYFPVGKGSGTWGASGGGTYSNSNCKNVTRVSWRNMVDRTKPAIVIQSEKTDLRGLTLNGRISTDTWKDRLPAILVYADIRSGQPYYDANRNNISPGTGSVSRDLTIHNCDFFGGTYACALGDALGDIAVDYFRATSIVVGDCDIGIYCLAAFSGQGMELSDVRGSYYDQYLIYFYSGCSALIRNLNPGHNSSTGSPIAFIGTSSSNFRNSNLRIENTKIDANFGGQTFLSAPCTNLSIALNGGTDSPIANGGSGFNPEFILLGGKNLLTIRDWQGVQGITHTTGTTGSLVAFESCRFWDDKIADPRSVVDETGGTLLRFTVRNCMGNEGILIDDIPTAGPQGETGPAGPQGPQGETGPAGEGDVTYVTNNTYINGVEYNPLTDSSGIEISDTEGSGIELSISEDEGLEI